MSAILAVFSVACLAAASCAVGEDVIYSLNVTESTTVQITLSPGSTTYSGIALDDTCPLHVMMYFYMTHDDNVALMAE